MAIGIFLGILIVAGVIALGFGGYYAADNDHSVAATLCAVGCILLCISFLIVPFSFHTVQSGEIAVVKTLGRITDVRTAGTNFDLWMTKSYTKYDTKVQDVEITTAAYSSDAQTMDILMTLQYQIMPENVKEIATQYGNLVALESRIKSIAIEKTKSVLSAHKAMDIIANRSTISPAVEEAIKNAIGAEYFVNVTAVVLTNIDFSDAFELAVEEKMIAEQAKLKADYENQTKVARAEAEAEAQLKRAQAAIDIAKAEAEAKKIAAEGEAAANKIITDSITDELLNKIMAENWDGKLPNTYVGDGSGLDIILPNS